VVRLKSGDPFLFGRGAEEMRFLREQGIPVGLVPGISSALAVPALAGVPVTHRGLSNAVTIVSGRCRGGKPAEWVRFANVGTLVILMGVEWREPIAQALIAAGRPSREPAVFIEKGTTPEERIVELTLEEIANGRATVEPPAVWVIGEVVRLRYALSEIAALGVSD
jgi:uroporphyrin-III C-methyltransferase